jgi:hypothetical protein
MQIAGRINFAENATTGNGTAFQYPGGKAKFFLEADFSVVGGAVKLQMQSPQGTWIDVPNTNFTANGMLDLDLPPCQLRAVLTQTLATAKVISAITKANPAVVTATAHGYSNGDRVFITGVVGMTQVNDLEFIVAGKTNDTFQLTGINSTAYTTYVSDGTAQKVSRATAAYVYAVGTPQ